MSFFDSESLPDDIHYAKKLLNEVQVDDEALFLVGIAKEKNANDDFVLDDGTGTIPVREIPEDQDSIENGQTYRVLGKISIDGSGTRFIAADVCQQLQDFNLELYQKAVKLKKTVE